jgi:hypothetical protein
MSAFRWLIGCVHIIVHDWCLTQGCCRDHIRLPAGWNRPQVAGPDVVGEPNIPGTPFGVRGASQPPGTSGAPLSRRPCEIATVLIALSHLFVPLNVFAMSGSFVATIRRSTGSTIEGSRHGNQLVKWSLSILSGHRRRERCRRDDSF